MVELFCKAGAVVHNYEGEDLPEDFESRIQKYCLYARKIKESVTDKNIGSKLIL